MACKFTHFLAIGQIFRALSFDDFHLFCENGYYCVILVPVKLFAAPLQGYTDAVYRHFHAAIYGGADAYFTPFVRIEGGEPRSRDLRDVASPLNVGIETVPQIIFKDLAEFERLVDAIRALGYRRIDLNMGCPFAPQVKKGRGAGVVANTALVEALAEAVASMRDIEFSVKMRLGTDNPGQWRAIVDSINSMPLAHVCLHPRTAAQQYGGCIDYDQLRDFRAAVGHPLVVNGDICKVEQIEAIGDYGVMFGRGLLSRPSLLAEYRSGEEMPRQERMRRLDEFHRSVFDYYSQVLCGDSQLLSKIKPFWDYLEPEIGHKARKAISKARSLAAYSSAVEAILSVKAVIQ